MCVLNKNKFVFVEKSAEKYVLEFLMNDDFIEYVVHPTRQLVDKWSDYFKRNPSFNSYAQSARTILKGEVQQIDNITEKEIIELKKRIIANCCISISN